MGEPAPRWFHCTSHTYGAWLHGDERSFRTRHHREHKIGDYKNRPLSEMYAEKLARCKKLLKQPPVMLLGAFPQYMSKVRSICFALCLRAMLKTREEVRRVNRLR